MKVTKRRAAIDFAECMRDLVDLHYPNAEKIRVVLDNLSTHDPKNLYVAFAPHEARRILERLEFHFTPKHASWLNQAEIEIGCITRECRGKLRFRDLVRLRRHVQAWVRSANQQRRRINWKFRTADARKKFGYARPELAGR